MRFTSSLYVATKCDEQISAITTLHRISIDEAVLHENYATVLYATIPLSHHVQQLVSNCNSFFLIVVVPVLRDSKCLTDDECQKCTIDNWMFTLTRKIVALSAEESKSVIATFKEAEVDPPELLLCKQT